MLYGRFKKFRGCFFGLEFNGKLSYTQIENKLWINRGQIMNVKQFVINRATIKEIIENQKELQEFMITAVGATMEEYHTAIFVECAEAIQETNFKWWKHTITDVEKLKFEIADIFIFSLDYSILQGQEKETNKLLSEEWTCVGAVKTDYEDMLMRLKLIGSKKYMKLYGSKFGLFNMRAIIDLIVMYNYLDFPSVIVKKQLVNIKRQQNGYNVQKECATE